MARSSFAARSSPTPGGSLRRRELVANLTEVGLARVGETGKRGRRSGLRNQDLGLLSRTVSCLRFIASAGFVFSTEIKINLLKMLASQ